MAHDPDTLNEFCRKLDSVEYWHITKEMLDQYASNFSEINFEYLQWAFSYYLPLKISDEKNPYVPAFQSVAGSFPPQLATLKSEVLDSWDKSLEILSTSILTSARISDLLSILGPANVRYKNAEIAFKSYQVILNTFNWDNLYLAVVAARCYHLAKQFNQVDWLDSSYKSIIKLIDKSLAGEKPQPGVVISLLEVLENEAGPDLIADLEIRVEQALQKYVSDFFNIDQILLLKARIKRLSGQDKNVARLRIGNWEKAANDSNGLVALMHIQAALHIAKNSGLKSEVNRLELLAEKVSQDSPPELQKIEGKVEIPIAVYESYKASFTVQDDFSETLLRLAIHSPVPIERTKDNDYISQLMNDFPVQNLFPVIVLNSKNLPIALLKTYEEKFEYEWAKFNTSRMLLWGLLFSDILDQFSSETSTKKVSFQDHLNISNTFTNFDKDIFSKCFEYYVEGKFDEVLHLALPRIEAVLRCFLDATGIPTYQMPFNNRKGAYLTLDGIISNLCSVYSIDSWNYSRSLLIDRFQLNLRNDVLHGLVGQANKIHAALVVHLILILSLLQVTAS